MLDNLHSGELGQVRGIKLKRGLSSMRFPDAGLRVVYVGEVYEPTGDFTVKGTGFLVRHDRGVSDAAYYLITADHVLKGLTDERAFAIRLNNKMGVSKVIRPPDGSHLKWWRHPTDESVDAAVFSWRVQPDLYDLKAFSTAQFDSQASRGRPMIGVGDEVFIVGLFAVLPGIKTVTPIVRHGHIAMMANERLRLAGYDQALAHMVEAHVTCGVSGAPVYVHETVSVPMVSEVETDSPFLDGAGNLYLLGLVHGNYLMSSFDEGILSKCR